MIESTTKSVPRPYILQVYQIQNKDESGRHRKVLAVSDGVWHIKGIFTGPEDVHEFDVVGVKEFNVLKMKDNNFLAIRGLKVVCTKLTALIGAPVEFGKARAPTVPDVEPIIPDTATVLEPALLTEEETIVDEEEILAAALAPIPAVP